MLHILLGILKIIGIILAVIVGLILLIICVVLFTALRYELKLAANGDVKNIEADIKFSWLLHLISGFVIYKEQKLDWQVRVAWKKLNVPKTEEPVKEEPVQVDSEVEEPVDEKPAEKIVHEPIKDETVETVPKRKSDNKEERKAKRKGKASSRKKKESIIEKIKCSFQKISDKIREIIALKDKIAAFIQAESHKKAFQKLLKELLRLLKKMKPKKLQGHVEFGFEDPYTTGSILAYASMLYPFYGDNISIKPNFEEVIISGDVYLKGHMRISYFVNMGFRLIIEKNVRLTIKDTMKLIAKK